MSLHHPTTPRSLRPAHVQPEDQLRHIGEHMGAVIIGLDRAMAKKTGKTVIQNLADAGGWEAPAEGAERFRMLEAALASRGMPYRSGGGEGGHDGWSLVRECALFATERDGIDVTRPYTGWGIEEADARKVLTQWGLTEVRTRHATPGDVLLFDMPENPHVPGSGGVHAAIMTAPGGEMTWAMLPGRTQPEAKMIHAYWGRAVVESWAGKWWTSKLIAAFTFDTADQMRAMKVAA